MAALCTPALVSERLSGAAQPMDPALLGENLRRNRLERTRARQAELRPRGKPRETPGAAAKAEPEQHTTDGTVAPETTVCVVADSWSLEFAARQVQRRATQVGLPVSSAASASNRAASTVGPPLVGFAPSAEHSHQILCSALGDETRRRRHNVSAKPLWPRRKLKKLRSRSLRMQHQRSARAQPGP